MLTLVPAYGRDYKTAKEVKADWESGKDFKICCFLHPNDGAYINKQDGSGQTFIIRFNRLAKVVKVKA